MKKIIKFLFRIFMKTLIILIIINLLFMNLKEIKIINFYQLIELRNIQDKIENLCYFGGSFVKGISEDLSQKVKDFRNEKTKI